MLSVTPYEDVPPLPANTICGQLGARSAFASVAMVTTKGSSAFKTDTMVDGKPTRTAGAHGAEERKRRGSSSYSLDRYHADALLGGVSATLEPPA